MISITNRVVIGLMLSLSWGMLAYGQSPVAEVEATKAKAMHPMFELVQHIKQREALMEQVAISKYQPDGMVTPYSAEQELSVLGTMGELAEKNGFSLVWSQVFAQTLADLSKQIEQYWLVKFQQTKRVPDSSMTLVELRDQIQQLDKKIANNFVMIQCEPVEYHQLNRLLSAQLSSIEGIPENDSQGRKVDFIGLISASIYQISQNNPFPAKCPSS